MTIITNQLITGFPKDVQHLVAEYLTIQDLNQCMRVSHVWQNLFDSDVMWEPIAKKFDIQKAEINSIHKFVIEKTNIVNYLPDLLKNQLLNDYKSLTHQKLSSAKQDYQKKYPEFVKVFDGITAIRHLPTVETTFDKLTNEYNYEAYQFDDKHFTSPIVRAIVKWDDNSKEDFILLRIRNNSTNVIYLDAISFHSYFRVRCFTTTHTRPHNRIICPMNCSTNVTEEKLNRLQRLIQGKPIGMIVTEIGDHHIIEGDKTIDNGKSTLELC
jgi:hypothetical protein